jgi:hypothetical protein
MLKKFIESVDVEEVYRKKIFAAGLQTHDFIVPHDNFLYFQVRK